MKPSFILLSIFLLFSLSACSRENRSNEEGDEPLYSGYYNLTYANSLGHLDINPYGQIAQVVHPKVLYFEKGFKGHSFWMAVTPYPHADFKLENPCIVYSDDGFNWTGIPANPLSLPDDQEDTYNSDTHLVYREDTQTLECWYRYVAREGETRYEQLKRRVSKDGLHWEDEQVVQDFSGAVHQALSPVILWEEDHYDIWVVRGTGGYHIEYYQSPDGTGLQKIRRINLTYEHEGEAYNVWHIDLVKDEGRYILLAMCKSQTTKNWSLFLSTSDDNIHYSEPEVVLLGSYSWDRQIYRSSIVRVDDEYWIYYSARDFDLNYYTSITRSKGLSHFVGAIR